MTFLEGSRNLDFRWRPGPSSMKETTRSSHFGPAAPLALPPLNNACVNIPGPELPYTEADFQVHYTPYRGLRVDCQAISVSNI